MLQQEPFYHGLLRKYVNAFGSLFNEMTLVRMNKARTVELKRFKVPIRYGPQEKYIGRIMGDPDLDGVTQIVLPMMSFENTSIEPDPSRKRNPLIRNAKAATASSLTTQYDGVPYNLTFELNIYAKTTDDANQIVEQILPTFAPDYNISNINIDDMGFTVDIPISLVSVSNNTEYEGSFDDVRVIQWTLIFTMKTYLYGPVSTQGLIKTVYANTYLDPAIQAGAIVRMNLGTGNGSFKLEEYAFQGNTLSTATAVGVVVKYDANNSYIRIGGAQGTFQTGEIVRSATSNAAYTVASFDASPLKLVSIKITPDPADAEPDDDYGYNIQTIEYPETL